MNITPEFRAAVARSVAENEQLSLAMQELPSRLTVPSWLCGTLTERLLIKFVARATGERWPIYTGHTAIPWRARGIVVCRDRAGYAIEMAIPSVYATWLAAGKECNIDFAAGYMGLPPLDKYDG